MRVVFAALAVLLASCAGAGRAPAAVSNGATPSRDAGAVESCSRVEDDGSRTLCHEVVVAAPREEVWRLLSTSEGLRSWVAPVVALELRLGGLWEASYNPDAALGDPGNIHNRVLSFAPGRMLSIQVDRAPPGFPHTDIVRGMWSVIELQDVGEGQTRVRVSGMGYRQGPSHDELYAFFDQGNAWTLQQLQRRIVGGPIDWRATAVSQLEAAP